MTGPEATAGVEIVGVPYDSGHRGRRMGAGPGHLVRSGLRSRIEAAGFTVAEREIEAPDGFPTENTTSFELARRVSDAVRETVARGAFPLVLSGNCGSSLGTVSGLPARPVGVVWLDAHADFNTPETTTSGFLDGMALSMLVGHCWKRLCESVPGYAPVPERSVLLVGARDLDDAERERLNASDVTTLAADEVEAGGDGRLARALEAVAREAGGIYLHVDLDALDPGVGRANDFAAPGGLTVGGVRELIRTIGRLSRIEAAAFTSYAPASDPENAVVDAAGELAAAILDTRRAAG